MQISRDAIILCGFAIRWYGILIALGALGAVIIAMRREARLNVPRDTSVTLAIICIPAGIIFARLYYVIFSWDYYGVHLPEIFDIRGGGLAIYGGVIGGVLAGFIYSRIKHLPFLSLTDLIAPGLAFAQAVGRWGNFVNQEAFGAAVENAGLKFFPMAVNISGTWHYATFFYESLWCMIITGTILLLEKKEKLVRPGDGTLLYLLMYAAERAMVEWLRTDSLYLGTLRVSQLLSLMILLAAACIIGVRKRNVILPILAAAVAIFVLTDLAIPAAICVLLCVGYAVYHTIQHHTAIRD